MGKKDIIVVPNCSAAELVARANERIKFKDLDSDIASWDFYKNRKGEVVDKGGKKYEVFTWPAHRDVPSVKVRAYFKEHDACGNTAAFIAWITQRQPIGLYASISYNDRLWRCRGGYLEAPFYLFKRRFSRLSHYHPGYNWLGDWVFVAFREIT